MSQDFVNDPDAQKHFAQLKTLLDDVNEEDKGCTEKVYRGLLPSAQQQDISPTLSGPIMTSLNTSIKGCSNMADGDFLHTGALSVIALREELQRCAAAPQDRPEGPIGRLYTDDAYFAHEKETVLKEGWFVSGGRMKLRRQANTSRSLFWMNRSSL